MSEENQENGTTNGSDVPEIELIIKEEFVFSKEEQREECAQQQLQQQRQQHEQQVQNFVYRLKPKKEELKNISNIYLTYDNNKFPHNIFVHLNCDDNAIDTNGDVMQDNNKEVLASTEDVDLECNQHDEDNKPHISQTTSSSSTSSNHEETYQTPCDSDSMNHMDFESVVAEACDGLFEDIENDLDLNLKEDPNSTSSMKVCECGGSGYVICKKSRDTEAMQMAVSAVLNEGMSLGQAAKKYNVVKSTIWSRVSKDPKHRRRKINKELAEVIHSKLSAGESLSEISRSLNVAKSTVHQHKARLTKYGQLPTVLVLKKDRENNANGGIKDRLMQAYRGCRVNGMSVRFAADFYSVPLTTLWRYIKRNQAAAQNAQPKIVATTTTAACSESNEEELEGPPIASAVGNAEADNIETDDIKTELNPEDQQLFEDTYLNHLFE